MTTTDPAVAAWTLAMTPKTAPATAAMNSAGGTVVGALDADPSLVLPSGSVRRVGGELQSPPTNPVAGAELPPTPPQQRLSSALVPVWRVRLAIAVAVLVVVGFWGLVVELAASRIT